MHKEILQRYTRSGPYFDSDLRVSKKIRQSYGHQMECTAPNRNWMESITERVSHQRLERNFGKTRSRSKLEGYETLQ